VTLFSLHNTSNSARSQCAQSCVSRQSEKILFQQSRKFLLGFGILAG
jgi:hypothetical protein